MGRSKAPRLKMDAPLVLEDAAELIGVSRQHIHRLVEVGWIKKPLTARGVVQGYIASIKDDKRRESKRVKAGDVQHERARSLRMDNDLKDGTLIPTDTAQAALVHVVSTIKSDLAGVPVRATDDLPLRRQIAKTIDDVLAGLAKRFEEAAAALAEGRDTLEASAGDDGERVGEEEQDLPALVRTSRSA